MTVSKLLLCAGSITHTFCCDEDSVFFLRSAEPDSGADAVLHYTVSRGNITVNVRVTFNGNSVDEYTHRYVGSFTGAGSHNVYDVFIFRY